MRSADQYPTVEQNWPRMYTEFADVYDRFADREWRDSPVYSTIDEIVDEWREWRSSAGCVKQRVENWG